MTETIRVERAVVTHRPEWGKWPDTGDLDYGAILVRRREDAYEDEGTGRRIEVTTREWPVFLSFARSTCELPYRYPPHLDNSTWPSAAVLDQQRQDLRALAKDGVRVVHWEHGYGCYPPVAAVLRDLFPLASLQFADDATGSSELKTLPVAGFFHAYLHAMKLMSFETGERVADAYRARGVGQCYFTASRETRGLIAWAATHGQTVEARARKIRQAADPFAADLAFVGAVSGNAWRKRLLAELDAASFPHLQVALYGDGTRRGKLTPRCPPEGEGAVVGPVYASARFGLNPQWTSVWNTRLFDLWHLGVPQLIYDPHGELAEEGFEAGAHYVGYDGTVGGLRSQIERYAADKEAQARIAVEGRRRADVYKAELDRVWGRVLFDAWERLW